MKQLKNHGIICVIVFIINRVFQKFLIQNSNSIVGGDDGNGGRKWKLGEIEFEACMRCLDNAVIII